MVGFVSRKVIGIHPSRHTKESSGPPEYGHSFFQNTDRSGRRHFDIIRFRTLRSLMVEAHIRLVAELGRISAIASLTRTSNYERQHRRRGSRHEIGL